MGQTSKTVEALKKIGCTVIICENVCELRKAISDRRMSWNKFNKKYGIVDNLKHSSVAKMNESESSTIFSQF